MWLFVAAAPGTGLNAAGFWVTHPLHGEQLPGGSDQLPGSRPRKRRPEPRTGPCTGSRGPAGTAGAAGSAGDAAGMAVHAIPAAAAVHGQPAAAVALYNLSLATAIC